MNMNLEQRIKAFAKLGEALRDEIRNPKSEIRNHTNGWFTSENITTAIFSIANNLTKEKLEKWLEKYQITNHQSPITNHQSVGVIMAGNIPLVGFHDFLCVLISGNIFVGKLSSDDKILLPKIAEILIEIEPKFKEKIFFVENFHISKSPKLSIRNPKFFIATGSDNSARYFEYYFEKYPSIIRKNRNSIAILNGSETPEEMRGLGKDVFQYFGLGCRNVSKIFVPEKYDFDIFFKAIYEYQNVINNNKYANNYDYNKTVYLMSKYKILDNGFLLLKEDNALTSPVAVVFYEYYKNIKSLEEKLIEEQNKIQCIVFNSQFHSTLERARVRCGNAQSPELWDYADGVDTLNFLLELT